MPDGYLPFATVDWDDAPFGDAIAERLSAAHCGPRDEARSLTARLHAAADAVANRDYDAVGRHHLRAALRELEAAVAGLEECV